jgi:hypothetical protein
LSIRAPTAPEHRSLMQRGYSALVGCVGVRAGINEKVDQRALRTRIRARTTIRGVMERFGSSSVAGANGGALGDQRPSEYRVMGSRGHMQCRVTGVDIVTNGGEEVRSWISATRSDPKGSRDQTGRLVKHARDRDVIMRGDRGEERAHRLIDGIGSRTWLHYRYRLANLVLGCSGEGSDCVARCEASRDRDKPSRRTVPERPERERRTSLRTARGRIR